MVKVVTVFCQWGGSAFRNALAVMSAGSTHPDYASLVDPLFACGGKRVAAIKF